MATDDTAATQLSRSLELLWRTSERSKPGPKPALTLERIVDAAIALADAEGIDALAMRRVADELGAGAMSLYRYVPGKTELLNLMLDRVHAPGEELAGATDRTWREITEICARQSWQRYVSHPWLLQVNWARPVLGPNMVADFEAALTGLEGLGLNDTERVMVADIVEGYVAGLARSYVLSLAAPEESGISDEEFRDHLTPALEAAVETGNYPTLATLADDAFAASWHETFEFGLQRLLDGLEQLVRNKTP